MTTFWNTAAAVLVGAALARLGVLTSSPLELLALAVAFIVAGAISRG